MRTLENGTEKDLNIYKQLLESSAFNAKMKQAHRYTKLLKTILLRPVWRSDSLQLDILTGNILDVVTGDSPDQLEKVLITDYGTSEKFENIEYSLWTAEEWQRLDYRGNPIESKTNPYGVLPFLPVFDYIPPSSTFWLPGLDALISLQEAINLKLSDLLYLIKMQSFGVGYIKGSEGGNIHVDPGTLVQLGNDPNSEIGFESQKAQIEQVVEAIDKLLKWACVSHGLSAGSMSTEPVDQSGISKSWDSRELAENRKDDIELWRSYEKQLFMIVRTVYNQHTTGQKISESATLSIDFADPEKHSMNLQEQTQADDLRITQGVLSPVDILLRDNPDFQHDREKALAHLIRIREEIRQLTE
jgi:hypothetical protein